MKPPYPMLWFNSAAEQAARFYVSLFPDSAITEVARYGEVPGRPAGEAMTVAFTMGGTPYVALNGGPDHRLSPAFSFVVGCEDQAEIDRLWETLTADGGEESMCGWLVDRFGVSWQIVPQNMSELLASPAAMEAMFTMRKIDVARLTEAAGE